MKIYRGDQYALPFALLDAEGAVIEPSMISDVKIGFGNYVFTYQAGTLLWDPGQKFWYIPLTEELTRSFRFGPKKVTAGIRIRDEIFYCDEQLVTIADNQIERSWDDA